MTKIFINQVYVGFLDDDGVIFAKPGRSQYPIGHYDDDNQIFDNDKNLLGHTLEDGTVISSEGAVGVVDKSGRVIDGSKQIGTVSGKRILAAGGALLLLEFPMPVRIRRDDEPPEPSDFWVGCGTLIAQIAITIAILIYLLKVALVSITIWFGMIIISIIMAIILSHFILENLPEEISEKAQIVPIATRRGQKSQVSPGLIANFSSSHPWLTIFMTPSIVYGIATSTWLSIKVRLLPEMPLLIVLVAAWILGILGIIAVGKRLFITYLTQQFTSRLESDTLKSGPTQAIWSRAGLIAIFLLLLSILGSIMTFHFMGSAAPLEAPAPQQVAPSESNNGVQTDNTTSAQPGNPSTQNESASPVSNNKLNEVIHNRRLTGSDLKGLSAWDLDILRNQLYAQHHYIFSEARQDLQKYFNQQSWYHGESRDDDKAFRQLNKIEQENVEFIREFQKQNGLITRKK